MKPLALDRYRLSICLGPGGVGKTTTSAALALRAAIEGHAVDVMTVDPAPRLLDALGLATDSREPQEIPLDRMRRPRAGASSSRGRLRAMRLDPKATFDATVRRFAPTPGAADAIIGGRIYRNLASAFAGVADYMAMEKLLELATDPSTDLVILDTPPAAEALDFLDAPRRLLELLNSRAISLLGSRTARSGARLVDLAALAVLRAFDRVTKLKLLADVQAFVRDFEGMYDGFADRARRASDLLRADTTAVIVVTTAESGRIEQAREFIAALERAGISIRAVLVNRAMGQLPEAAELDHARITPALKRKLLRNLADYAALKKREAISFESLRAAVPASASLMIAPELGHEPQSLADLAQIGRLIHEV